MKPLGHRVLVEPIKEKLEEASGIVRPEDSKKREVAKGKVIAIGEEVKNVQVGQEVLFSPLHYDEISKELFVILDEDIWVLCTTTTA